MHVLPESYTSRNISPNVLWSQLFMSSCLCNFSNCEILYLPAAKLCNKSKRNWNWIFQARITKKARRESDKKQHLKNRALQVNNFSNIVLSISIGRINVIYVPRDDSWHTNPTPVPMVTTISLFLFLKLELQVSTVEIKKLLNIIYTKNLGLTKNLVSWFIVSFHISLRTTRT